MGFLIDSLLIDRFGITLNNAYVTIKASFNVVKHFAIPTLPPSGPSPAYMLTTTYYVYKSEEQSRANNVPALSEGYVRIPLDTFPAGDISALIYDAVKAKFTGKTFIDC